MKKFRKIISFFAVTALFVAGLPSSTKASEEAVLTLEKEVIAVKTPETFTVPVRIKNNPGLMGLDVEVNYDKSVLTPLEVVSGELLKDETVNDSIETSKESSFHIMFAGSQNITGDGDLFQVKFRMDGTAEAGYTNVTFNVNSEDTYNENYEDVAVGSATLKVNTPKSQEKAALELAVFMDNWKVGETPSVPKLVGNTGNGDVVYEYSDSVSGEFSTQVPTEAGKYYLRASVCETDDYYGGVTTTTFSILTDTEGGDMPSSSPKPSGDAAASEKPGQTTTPGATEAAGASEKPGQTEAAGASEKPDQTKTPGATEAAGASEKPDQTKTPGATEAAGASEKPDQTTAPGETGAPVASEAPDQTKVSGAPDATKNPDEVTESSAPTSSAIATGTPDTTATPDPTQPSAKPSPIIVSRTIVIKTSFAKLKRAGKHKVQGTIKRLDGADHYVIRWSLKRNMSSAKYRTLYSRKFKIKGLKSKRKYYFQVMPVADGVKSAWSATRKIRVK